MPNHPQATSARISAGTLEPKRAVRGAGEHRERNAVLRARVRVQEDRDEHDRVAEQDREERLRPVHAGRHQPRRQHVGGNAVRHADPQRGVVVGRPVAARQRHRRQILVVERARLDAAGVDELDPAVRRAVVRSHHHVRSLSRRGQRPAGPATSMPSCHGGLRCAEPRRRASPKPSAEAVAG